MPEDAFDDVRNSLLCQVFEGAADDLKRAGVELLSTFGGIRVPVVGGGCASDGGFDDRNRLFQRLGDCACKSYFGAKGIVWCEWCPALESRFRELWQTCKAHIGLCRARTLVGGIGVNFRGMGIGADHV